MTSSDYRLIELIRQNKHLYNQRDPDFRNLEKKELTWQAIADAQGSTPEICKRRFRSLRDRFVRERRHRKSELLDGTTPNPIWLKMMFLSEHLRYRKRFTWNQHKRSEPEELESSEVDGPDQKSTDMAEQNVDRSSQHHVEEKSVADVDESPTKRIKRYRPIQPKPDISNQRNNPIIVNLVPKGSRNSGGRGTSEAESDDREKLKEIDDDLSGPSTSERQNRDDDDTSNSQISCNDAFCLMLKDSLDQVTNPLRLSLLRIKILTILHNEVHG